MNALAHACRALLFPLCCAAVLGGVLGGTPSRAYAAEAPPPIKVGILFSQQGTMAESEAVLKDVALMLIEERNKKGGLLGRRIEAVVADPASDWPAYARLARRMLADDGVAAIFGGWTSASRKAMLPVVEELNGLLYYPLQYEGQESSRNIFYTGAVPNQQAIPAVEYLMNDVGEGAKRWVLVGTDYVYPRTTNEIIGSFLRNKGVAAQDILVLYTPFSHADWRPEVERIAKFVGEGKAAAIVSTVNGDANIHFYRELARQALGPADIPTVAFSAGEREFAGISDVLLAGQMAAWSYLQNVNSPENDAFIAKWRAYAGDPRGLVNDPMESVHLGFTMWTQAVLQAGDASVNAVRQAMYGQRVKAPSGFDVVMNANHHLSKPLLIGRVDENGRLVPVWRSLNPLYPDVWSKYLPESAPVTADWRYPWVCGHCTEPSYK